MYAARLQFPTPPDVCRPPTGSTSAADADAFRSGSGRSLDRGRILSLRGIDRGSSAPPGTPSPDADAFPYFFSFSEAVEKRKGKEKGKEKPQKVRDYAAYG